MALDYDTANSGLFFRQGAIVHEVVEVFDATMLALVGTAKQNIIDPFEAIDLDEQIEGFSSTFFGIEAQLISIRQTISAMSDAVWSDRVTSLDELDLFFYSPSSYFPALFAQMVLDTETIHRAVVTLGTMTAAAGNIGNGTVIISKRLDGFNSPLAGAPVIPGYAASAVDSELACTETMSWLCTADQFQGASEGTEVFSWQGAANDPRNPWGLYEGSGPGPSLTATGSDNILSGGDMENFTANIPDGWTRIAGTVVTHIDQTTTSGEYYRGTSALKFIGDGAQASMEIEQAIDTGTVNPQRMYCLTARVKCSHNAPAAGAVEIALRGTGWSPASSEKITIAAAALTTSWQLGQAFILLPLVLPSDLEAYVKWSGTPTSGRSLYVDDVILTPVTYHGGVCAAVVPGSTPFAVGDKFTCTVANNDNDGNSQFQVFFRRWYGVQMPSDASPSIAESLVA